MSDMTFLCLALIATLVLMLFTITWVRDRFKAIESRQEFLGKIIMDIADNIEITPSTNGDDH